MTQTDQLTETEQKAIASLCILAATADGSQSELERTEIKRLVKRLSDDGLDLSAAYSDALAGRASMPKLATEVRSNEGKQLAYEMAVCVCSVDNALSQSEKQFLSNLHRALDLDLTSTSRFQEDAEAFSVGAMTEPPVLSSLSVNAPALPTSSATPPSVPQSGNTELDEIILNRAILAGALEVMPQNLSTMAIIPVQMQLVYQIGKRYGFDLSMSHTKEFLATIGVGMTSQVVESYLTKFVRGATKKFGGKLVSTLAGQATESAIAFATTYAIGHAANRYYASGRTLSMDQLRDIFSQLLSQGNALKTQYGSQIAQQSGNLNIANLLSFVRK